MKLIALVVEKYKDIFEKQIFNFSDEFIVDFDFNNRELSIKANEDYITDFYGKSIYNITPIVGINGAGKSHLVFALAGWVRHVETKFLYVYRDFDGQFKCFCDNFELDNSMGLQILSKKPSPILIGLDDSDTSTVQFKEGRTGFLSAHFYEQFERLPQFLLAVEQAYQLLKSENSILESPLKLELTLRLNDSHSGLSGKNDLELLYANWVVLLTDFSSELELSIGSSVNYTKQNLDDLISSNAGNSVMVALKHFLDEFEKLHREKHLVFEKGYASSRINRIVVSNEKTDLKRFFELLYRFEEVLHEKIKKDLADEIFYRQIKYAMSKGEKNILKTCANILYSSQKKGQYLFLIDEVESGLHLEWSRRWVKFLIDFIRKHSPDSIFQFIFTTHSPYMLSDIKPGNIIALEKKNEGGKQFSVQVEPYPNTFAKNIQEIMHDDMFISNIYGEFAVQKINEIIDHLNSDDRYDEERQQSLKKEILLISESLIRNKLLDMYRAKYIEQYRNEEDEILRLIANLPEEQQSQLIEKLASQQKNL